MARKFNIKPNEIYGKYKTIEKVPYITPAGTKEQRWKCENIETGEISYKRNRALDERSQEDLMSDVENQMLVKHNLHQMGLRKALFIEYQSNADSRNHQFLLTFEQFNDLISGKCAYCGSEPKIKNGGHFEKRKHKDQPDLYTNGVDRIDSSKDYTIDNCVSCCSMCNKMKNVYSKNDFLNHIKEIYLFNFKEGSSTISKESTSEVIADGSGTPQNNLGEDIVTS